ncbi:hypothetical protein Mmol_1223 [Methylotenera mobilis JLW8]|uniref:Uncharacterized protein n=1 Tax=Methylotenera mobilis (strain JLW8 / ATCC BAA-1282 / DSM 17540) TaxID=583345 RepID=C6WW30_METML|nr:hypothetical protein Mmol_1223 [Methylotenera mobilis JLW8]
MMHICGDSCNLREAEIYSNIPMSLNVKGHAKQAEHK